MKNTIIKVRKNIDSDSALELDSRWMVETSSKKKTLQYFITSRCNNRCDDCFFQSYLGKEEVDLEYYKSYVKEKKETDGLEKINLLGGEPTLYSRLDELLRFNDSLGLRTNVYSNGICLDRIPEDLTSVVVRLSCLSYDGYKPVQSIETNRPITLVYPLSKKNVSDLDDVVSYCENLNMRQFVFSTIKKLEHKGDFFEEKDDCLTSEDYISVLNDFFRSYSGKIKEFHINSRGIFETGMNDYRCNFINKLYDGRECNCPFDIDIHEIKNSRCEYGVPCYKNDVCLLQKIIVKSI